MSGEIFCSNESEYEDCVARMCDYLSDCVGACTCEILYLSEDLTGCLFINRLTTAQEIDCCSASTNNDFAIDPEVSETCV